MEISACSGNARRRRLARILGSSILQNYLESISIWNDKRTQDLYFDSLNAVDIRAFEKLWRDHAELRESLGVAVAASLEALLQTGTYSPINPSLHALWAPNTTEFWTISFPHASFPWTGLLSDTSDSCTVAIITQECLIMKHSRDFGCQGQLYSASPSVLETAMLVNPRALKKDTKLAQGISSTLDIEKEETFDLGSSGQLKYVRPISRSRGGILMDWLHRSALAGLKDSLRESILKKSPSPCHSEQMYNTGNDGSDILLINVHVR